MQEWNVQSNEVGEKLEEMVVSNLGLELKVPEMSDHPVEMKDSYDGHGEKRNVQTCIFRKNLLP